MLRPLWHLLVALCGQLWLPASVRHFITKQIIHFRCKAIEKKFDRSKTVIVLLIRERALPFAVGQQSVLNVSVLYWLSVSHSCTRSRDFQINGAQPGFYCASFSQCYRIHDPYPLQDEVSLVQSKDKERKKACVTSASVHVCGKASAHTFVIGLVCFQSVIQLLEVLYLW